MHDTQLLLIPVSRQTSHLHGSQYQSFTFPFHLFSAGECTILASIRRAPIKISEMDRHTEENADSIIIVRQSYQLLSGPPPVTLWGALCYASAFKEEHQSTNLWQSNTAGAATMKPSDGNNDGDISVDNSPLFVTGDSLCVSAPAN